MLSQLRKHQQQGFTIIEVMIVLAIAGLIMVVVLIAVPQLQRNQRNTAMKDVLGRIRIELDNYSGNNNGSYPSTAADMLITAGTAPTGSTTFVGRYLSAVNINDPKTGTNVGMALIGATTAPTLPPSGGRQVNYYYNNTTGFKCSGESIIAGTGARNIAIAVALEGGAIYCLDNQ